MIKKYLILLICTAFIATGCKTTDSVMYELNESDEPQEYQQEEFPQWLNEIRRAEIIFAGSIPFTILLTNIGYGIYSGLSEGIDASYSIENFTQTSLMTTEERYNILKISLSLSAAISLADFIIGLFDEPVVDE